MECDSGAKLNKNKRDILVVVAATFETTARFQK